MYGCLELEFSGHVCHSAHYRASEPGPEPVKVQAGEAGARSHRYWCREYQRGNPEGLREEGGWWYIDIIDIIMSSLLGCADSNSRFL